MVFMPNGDVVVGRRFSETAPTGEAYRYRTADGTEWRSSPSGAVQNGRGEWGYVTGDGRIER